MENTWVSRAKEAPDVVHIIVLIGTHAADETVDHVVWYDGLKSAVKKAIAEHRS